MIIKTANMNIPLQQTKKSKLIRTLYMVLQKIRLILTKSNNLKKTIQIKLFSIKKKKEYNRKIKIKENLKK